MMPIELEIMDTDSFNEKEFHLCSLQLTNGAEIFAGVTEDENHNCILQHPLRVQAKVVDEKLMLAFAPYNPFSDDWFVRIKQGDVHHINLLNDRFVTSYTEAASAYYPFDATEDVAVDSDPEPVDAKAVSVPSTSRLTLH